MQEKDLLTILFERKILKKTENGIMYSYLPLEIIRGKEYNFDDNKIVKCDPKKTKTFRHTSKDGEDIDIPYMGDIYSLSDQYVYGMSIDISSQSLKLYVDDKLIVDTLIVTGKDTSPTYCGLFSVREKERNVYWEEFGVKVKYWMPFNRGEGMHDAKWRKKFGGDIYHKDGSHGCVNIPTKIMPTIYDNVDIGAPVLVKK